MSRRTKYSDEEKFRIVSMVLDNKLAYKEVAERTSVPEGTVATFVNKYRNQYGSESPVSLGLVKVDQLMEVQEETKWYTSKEMCEMNNVCERTLENFNVVCSSPIKKGGYHNSQNLYSEEQANEFKYWLQKNQASQGRGSEMAKEEVNKMVENEKWYTSKEMCEMNNVDERTLARFNEVLNDDIDVMNKLVKKGGYHNRAYFYSEEALKQFQMWLMRNQANQGRSSEAVKQNTTQMVSTGLTFQAVLNSGDEDTFNEFINFQKAAFEDRKRSIQLEAQNRLALEENKKLEEENNRLEEENNRLEEENAEKDVIINKQMVNTEFFKNDKEALSYEQAARLLGISVKTLISTLQDRHILLSHGEPQQKYIDEKWFIWSLDTEQTDYGYLNHEWSYITPVGMTHLEKLFPKL